MVYGDTNKSEQKIINNISQATRRSNKHSKKDKNL